MKKLKCPICNERMRFVSQGPTKDLIKTGTKKEVRFSMVFACRSSGKCRYAMEGVARNKRDAIRALRRKAAQDRAVFHQEKAS